MNRELLEAAHELEFRTTLGELTHLQNVSEKDYVSALSESQSELRDYAAELKHTMEAVARLRTWVANEDWIPMEREILRMHSAVWGMLEGGWQRNEIQLSERASGGSKVHPISTVSGGDLSVDLTLGALVFRASYREGNARNKAKTLATKVANAYATRDRGVLLEVFDQLRKHAPLVETRIKTVHEATNAELSKFQRVVVAALLVNRGRLAYSTTNHARFTVDLKGYPRQSGSEPERRHDPTVQTAATLDLEAVIEDETESFIESIQSLQERALAAQRGKSRAVYSPIRHHSHRSETRAFTVKDATTVEWISREPVADHELSAELRAAYAGGERGCRLTVAAVVPARKPIRVITSRTVPFRDVGDSALAPAG